MSNDILVYNSEQHYLYHLECHGYRIVKAEGDKYWLRQVAPNDEEGGRSEEYNQYDEYGIYCGKTIS